MNCPKCFENNIKLKESFETSTEINAGHQHLVLLARCLNCSNTFYIESFVIIKELERLLHLEKAVNLLHYFLANNPTFQRLSATNEDFDAILCDIEQNMDFEKNYEQKIKTS